MPGEMENKSDIDLVLLDLLRYSNSNKRQERLNRHTSESLCEYKHFSSTFKLIKFIKYPKVVKVISSFFHPYFSC